MSIKKLWETDKYYKRAGEGSENYNHPGMILLKKLAENAENILDVGCGEGTRLNFVANGKTATGVDISHKAIALAKKKYKKHKFQITTEESLSAPLNHFDLVYSAFVLEHTRNPEEFIKQMLSATKKGGSVVLMAPNYGAPNRCSPCFKGSRVSKFISGFINDFLLLFVQLKDLNWLKVEPLATTNKYDIDYDTTVEPYINSLVNYLNKNNIKIIKSCSLWQKELPNPKLHQRVFRKLSDFKIYPFVNWGPQILVHGIKQ